MQTTFEKVRSKIQRNMPKVRKPLEWKKITERIIRSKCDRFQIERRGEDEGTRYYAFILPDIVIGHRLATPEFAKQVCEQHAVPKPLEVTP